EVGVVAADQRDERRVNSPDAHLQLAEVLALGHVDGVAALALLERLPGVLEGLLLAAVAAGGAGLDEPVAALGTRVADRRGRLELLDGLDEEHRLGEPLDLVRDAAD